ncbi:hypothetical protein [Helicobacter sp.]|nr:hypothetical protein [Helicobacter sp.]MDY2584508.1 hypothetical protein [Helicobacter sp.]
MPKVLTLLTCASLIFCFNACSTKGYANSKGGAGYTEWRLSF